MSKRVTEKKTFWLTKDADEHTKHVYLWASKPSQDEDGNYDIDNEEEIARFHTDCETVVDYLEDYFDIEIVTGTCIKISLEIDREETVHDQAESALKSQSTKVKDDAIRALMETLQF